MTTSREQAVADLRASIDILPERTRRAMLAGLASNTVITGAFSDGSGVCPMLAAHREGVRSRCMGFPEAWDRFTGVYGRCLTRPATNGEVLHLRMQLEESLNAPPVDASGFAAAIAEHEATVRARANAPAAADTDSLADAIAEHEATAAERRRRSRELSGGFVVDLSRAIEEHLSTARGRRGREATEVGLDWLFEETLVLPEDFDRDPEPEVQEAEEFDFSREPTVLPSRPRGRSILK
jgi:hypothetical protein